MKFKSPYGLVREVAPENVEVYEKSGWAPVEDKPQKTSATKPKPAEILPPAMPDPAATPE